MIVIFIRTFIIFILLVIVMRLMGKRQIGEMQPFEFIITLIIADLACIPMADVSIPLLYGITAVGALFVLHQLLSVLEFLGDKFKFVISGKPSVVINKNGVDLRELKKNNMDTGDLIESMRSSGYFSLDDLDYAIFESNGKLSAMENSERKNSPSSLPVLVINGGKIIKDNLQKMGYTRKELIRFLYENKEKLLFTEVMTVDGNGRVYYKAKNKKYKILSLPIKEELKW